MQDDMNLVPEGAHSIDARVLRHMMMETIDLLDASSDHADEACQSTDAAMALTRVDWMLMAVFNWLTRQLRTDSVMVNADATKTLGEPVSIIGIRFETLSEELRSYSEKVDRLHARGRQLESLVASTVAMQEAVTPHRTSGKVLHIFGDPDPSVPVHNAVIETRQRLISAFAGS